ncbi:MAG: hypothetical protein CR988_01495 [Treponema sp.]|nr:MAG: hypothetical protein CR988_01495 [Treponema sp.]
MSIEVDDFSHIEIADIYLIATTSSHEFDMVMSKINNEKSVLVRLTFKKEAIHQLRKIHAGTDVLLVNLSMQMAIETISDLHRVGITGINFIPVYPNQKNIPDISIAVTPGERRYVPKHVQHTIDIGNRLLTAGTITELALKLELPHILENEKYKNYSASLAEQNYSITALRNKNLSIENTYQILIESLDIAIIGIDTNGKIFICNQAFYKKIKIQSSNIIGKKFSTLFTNWHEQIRFENNIKETNKIIKIENIDFVANIIPIFWREKIAGHYILLQKFSDTENRQNNLRIQLLQRGHTSKYTFNDIIGESEAIVKAKQIAKKAAHSDLAILLTGETGTGKELFAHSIHHESARSEMPFLAVNCAALSETLLESELFGYVEGAFTGAKKGGKVGFFEYAHNGTLFLDEIEGMSTALQIKLLRVLQEKEIMRVGDNKIIKVNVRIIAASNQNIKTMVDKGTFRKDLYYRLNTIPIEIPLLRRRGKDVLLISRHIMKQINAKFTLSSAVENFFLQYKWDGNIRELYNILEYLNFLNEPVIKIKSLPASILDLTEKESKPNHYNRNTQLILEMLCDVYPSGLGRRSILNKFKNSGLTISENNLRNTIEELKKKEMIKVNSGRSGTTITKKGFEFLNNQI